MHYKRLGWIKSLDRWIVGGVSKLAGAGTAAGRECCYSGQGRSRVLAACMTDSRPVCLLWCFFAGVLQQGLNANQD